MRIVILGIIIFLGWLAFSNYWYLSNICEGCGKASDGNESSHSRHTFNAPFDHQKTADLKTSGRKVMTVYPSFAQKSDSILDEEALSSFVRELDALLGRSNSFEQIQIVGHTDDVGEATQNYVLGLQRAVAVRDFLARMGFSANKIAVSSQGEVAPLVPNTSHKNQEKNRRIDIYIQP